MSSFNNDHTSSINIKNKSKNEMKLNFICFTVGIIAESTRVCSSSIAAETSG